MLSGVGCGSWMNHLCQTVLSSAPNPLPLCLGFSTDCGTLAAVVWRKFGGNTAPGRAGLLIGDDVCTAREEYVGRVVWRQFAIHGAFCGSSRHAGGCGPVQGRGESTRGDHSRRAWRMPAPSSSMRSAEHDPNDRERTERLSRMPRRRTRLDRLVDIQTASTTIANIADANLSPVPLDDFVTFSPLLI